MNHQNKIFTARSEPSPSKQKRALFYLAVGMSASYLTNQVLNKEPIAIEIMLSIWLTYLGFIWLDKSNITVAELSFEHEKLTFKNNGRIWTIPYSRLSHIERFHQKLTIATDEVDEVHIFTNDNDSYSIAGELFDDNTLAEINQEIAIRTGKN